MINYSLRDPQLALQFPIGVTLRAGLPPAEDFFFVQGQENNAPQQVVLIPGQNGARGRDTLGHVAPQGLYIRGSVRHSGVRFFSGVHVHRPPPHTGDELPNLSRGR